MTVLVGTSGWQYDDWRGRCYPAGLPKGRWLERHAELFGTVEVNNAFYRLPAREVFEAWAARTPDDYLVTVKASRFLSHVKRLREPEEPIARLLERATGLGPQLGPFLLQLPPTMRVELERLDACLARFPAGVRVAVEPRHDSWWVPGLRDVLERHRAALVWADRGGRPVAPLWRTADWGYLRLHTGEHGWRYEEDVLAGWADRLLGTWGPAEDLLAYTNNDPGGAALVDAVVLARLLRERGAQVGRVPELAQVS